MTRQFKKLKVDYQGREYHVTRMVVLLRHAEFDHYSKSICLKEHPRIRVLAQKKLRDSIPAIDKAAKQLEKKFNDDSFLSSETGLSADRQGICIASSDVKRASETAHVVARSLGMKEVMVCDFLPNSRDNVHALLSLFGKDTTPLVVIHHEETILEIHQNVFNKNMDHYPIVSLPFLDGIVIDPHDEVSNVRRF
jgi:hypothetical protein